MRALFLVTDDRWSARARVFLLAARGLTSRGHATMLACADECPVQTRAGEAEMAVVKLGEDASSAGAALTLRRAVQQADVDVVFVHSDAELLVAGSAMRLGRKRGRVIRRVPPFAALTSSRRERFAARIAPTGLLFSTEQDRAAAEAGRHAAASSVAPLGIDTTEHDRIRETGKTSLGAPAGCRLVVCVYDGADARGVLSAMRTVALLSPRHPELHLAVVGAGGRDELRMHGAALGINARVTYLGTRDDELSVLRAADIGWVAATGDAAALAAMDFMAFGIPVLAERSALTEHYIADGIAGCLLTRDDPTTTAGTVAAFLAKKEQLVQMGKAGRARLQREFTLDAMIDGFLRAMGAPSDAVA